MALFRCSSASGGGASFVYALAATGRVGTSSTAASYGYTNDSTVFSVAKTGDASFGNSITVLEAGNYHIKAYSCSRGTNANGVLTKNGTTVASITYNSGYDEDITVSANDVFALTNTSGTTSGSLVAPTIFIYKI